MRRELARATGWARVLVPLSSVGLLHCTLGGLSALGEGPPRDAGGGDARSSVGAVADAAPDASTIDPVVDASGVLDSADTADASVPTVADAEVDAVVDAAPDASSTPASAPPSFLDAGTLGWCDTHLAYLFCDDFDKRPLPSNFAASDGPYLIQTSSLPSSAPNDLLLYVPAQTGGGSWGSKLSMPFNTPATSLVMEFDVNPGAIDSLSSGILFAGIDFTGNANAKYSVRLAYNAGAPRLEESYINGSSDIFHGNFSLTPDSWSRIQVALTFAQGPDAGADAGATTGTETISINGAQVQTQTLTPNPGFDPRPTLLIGAVFGTNPTGGWVFRYDNVTFDIQ